MADAYDSTAFRARFLAAMKPAHNSIAGLRCQEPAAPHPPRPAPLVAAPPTAAELEFERVRAAACARIDAERAQRNSEKHAARMILDAYAAFEPADRATSRSAPRGSDAEEQAAALILSFMLKQRS